MNNWKKLLQAAHNVKELKLYRYNSKVMIQKLKSRKLKNYGKWRELAEKLLEKNQNQMNFKNRMNWSRMLRKLHEGGHIKLAISFAF